MKFRLKNHKFTLMFIPHNNSEVRSMKVPAFLINALALFGLFSFVVFGVLFVNSARLEDKLIENDKLKTVNHIQNEELRALKEDTQKALERLEQIKETDQKVREMVGLKVLPPEGETASRSANGGSPFASRQLTTTGVDLLSLTYEEDVADLKDKDRRDYGLEDIKEIRAMLDLINSETEDQEKVLSVLEKDTADRIRFLAAKPSGRPSGGRITSAYGWRANPFSGRGSEFHSGVDLAGGYGANIVSTGSGRVSFAGYRAGFGYTVVINHGYGYTTTYAHCSAIHVKTGDQVKRGQVIAKIGRSGRATGAHLHYEVTYNGKTINPTSVF